VRHHVIDMTTPGSGGEMVEIKTPAGTIHVIGGVVAEGTATPAVVTEVHNDLEWSVQPLDRIARWDVVLTPAEP
jgi:hypothetical protein